MTNYNQRLDEILDTIEVSDKGVYECAGGHELDNYSKTKAKQAITPLIKELVAEAKPKDYTPEGHHPDACLNHKEYTSACCGCQKQRARNHAVYEFEQNLLKALEVK